MISKRTINELLEEYLDEKLIDGSVIAKIKRNLHKDVKKAEEGDYDTEVSHGTSCPRIMIKGSKELLIEM